jgi:hypothetical protein
MSTHLPLHQVANAIHIFVQGKGGIMKSGCAALLAQYLATRHRVLSIDTDTENKTLCRVSALGAKDFTILDTNNDIDIGEFDRMVEAAAAYDGPVLVDNGANSFRPLLTYLRRYDVVQVLEDLGRQVIVHTIVAGGAEYADTSAGAVQVAQATGNAPIVIWRNAFFGPLSSGEGADYFTSPMFKEIAHRVAGTVALSRPDDLVLAVIKKMQQAGLTVAEAGRSDQFTLMEKQRLCRIWHPPIVEALDGIEIPSTTIATA